VTTPRLVTRASRREVATAASSSSRHT
jgi:hypothetical protein